MATSPYPPTQKRAQSGRKKKPGPRFTPAQRAAVQETFLTIYAQTANLSESAAAAGVDRTTVRDWQEHDETFTFRCQQASEQANDALRSEIRRRGLDGWDEDVYQLGKYAGTIHRYSDTLLIFHAKARMPGEYRERSDVTITGSLDLINRAAAETDRLFAALVASADATDVLGEPESGGES